MAKRRIGHCRSNRRVAAVAACDNDNDDTTSSYSVPKTVYYYLEQLFEKRRSSRENALSSIIEAFTNKLHHAFAEEKFATLLDRCLNLIKKGSAKETCLASHAIGLLALTTVCGDNAHEIYEESLPPLSQALKSKFESGLVSSILHCLAIVTFLGTRNSEETERSMQIIWELIHPAQGSNSQVVASKQPTVVLAAAISAWSFLLTTMDGWRLSYKYWQGAISYFSSLLKHDDESVHIVSCEALALILETNCVEKFSSEAKGFIASSIYERTTSSNEYSCTLDLKDKILKQVRSLLEKGRANCDVLKFFEDGYYLETSIKIGKTTLTLSAWSQLIQLNFLKQFLGGGFVRHMQENEILHNVFEFTPNKENLPSNEQHISDSEKVIVQFFLPEVRNKDSFQRIYKSPNSVFSKARTQLLKKHRVLSQGRNISHYVVDDGNGVA